MKKAGLFKLSEFLAISALAVICMSKLIYFMLCAMKIKPRALDNWFMCYSLQYQAQRISCLDLGNLWRGGFFYPFHDVSLLFDAPSFGISLLITPVWMITGNIFSIFRLGGVFAIYLTWILTYYFLKNAGCKRSWAFSAGALFCFCGSALILINGQYGFWSFFMVPLLGILTLKIFSAPKVYWGILWGVVLGYLAWSSAHVFVMGGLFILLFALWH